MKHIQKIGTLLLALALLVALLPLSQTHAIGYTAVSPTTASLGLQEKLSVNETGAASPDVTYTLKLSSAMQIYSDGTVTYGEAAGVKNSLATGTTVATVSFTAGEVIGISSAAKAYTDDAAFITALHGMSFDRPGIYYWTIEKQITSLSTSYTNHNRSQSGNTGTALVVRVDDIGGTLTPSVNVVATDVVGTSGKPVGNKITLYEDNYTAKVGNLFLKKEVTGNQGAKDQYFKFHIEVSGLPGLAGYTYTVTTTEGPGIVTPKYGENGGLTYTNPTSFTLDSSGAASGDVWLKDQEQIVVENFPQSGKIKITESENTGYTVTNSYDDGTVHNGTGNEVNATMPNGGNLRVVYKNDKASTVPTGVALESLAPLAGVVVALILAAVLVISRFRRSRDAR